MQEIRFDPWVEMFLWRRKWPPTPVFLLENPMDRGARWVTVGCGKESDTAEATQYTICPQEAEPGLKLKPDWNRCMPFWLHPSLLPRDSVNTYECVCVKRSAGWSVMSNSLRPHGLYSPWNSPGQNTGVGSLYLLQGIFPTQGSNPALPHCKWILYQLSRKGSPYVCVLYIYILFQIRFHYRLL
jgi:hypothetical protein